MTSDASKDRRILWAKRSAVHYLGSYSSSEENLRRTMLRRAARKFDDLSEGEAEALAEEAVRFCRENGFLDDGTYAQGKAVSGQGKGHSRRRVRMALVAKGVDPETAAEAAAQVDDLKAAVTFARRRRFGPWRTGPDSREARQKEAAAMGRAGFSGEIAFKVASMEMADAEEVLYAEAPPVS